MRTTCINGKKSTFTAYSTHGQLKPQLILAEEFWAGLIQAASYLGRESVLINALKRCLRLGLLKLKAKALCWSRERMLRMLCFQLSPDLHGRETRAAVAGKWPAAPELHKRAGKFRLNPTSSIAGTSLSNHSIDHWRSFRRGFRKSIATTPHSNLDRSVNLKRKR